MRFVLQLLFLLIGNFLFWQVLFRNHRPATRRSSSQVPLSVIIPARNEGQTIGRLLESLNRQRRAPLEILVVDDGSTDNTAEVARRAGAQVITAASLPEGFNGKAWACWQGALHSQGELLLFLDADTWLEDDGLERLLALYQDRGLLTIQPYHVTQRPYEQLSAFFNLVVIAAVGAFTPLGERVRPGGAFGPCVLCRRTEYFQVGGHQQVGAIVLEDIVLAQLYHRHNLPVRCQIGQGIINFRMYPQGLGQLFEGWSKGIGFGAASVNPIFSLLTAAWITGCFGVFSAPLVYWARGTALPQLIVPLLLYLLYALQLRFLLSRLGRFQSWAWMFYPIPLSFFALTLLVSFIMTYVFRRVAWRGRRLRVGAAPK